MFKKVITAVSSSLVTQSSWLRLPTARFDLRGNIQREIIVSNINSEMHWDEAHMSFVQQTWRCETLGFYIKQSKSADRNEKWHWIHAAYLLNEHEMSLCCWNLQMSLSIHQILPWSAAPCQTSLSENTKSNLMVLRFSSPLPATFCLSSLDQKPLFPRATQQFSCALWGALDFPFVVSFATSTFISSLAGSLSSSSVSHLVWQDGCGNIYRWSGNLMTITFLHSLPCELQGKGRVTEQSFVFFYPSRFHLVWEFLARSVGRTVSCCQKFGDFFLCNCAVLCCVDQNKCLPSVLWSCDTR